MLSEVFNRARASGRHVLDESASKRVLLAYGLTVPHGILVPPGSDPALDGLSGPFAVKLVSPDAVHKSDVGGVRLGVPDAAAARAAVHDLEALARTKSLPLDGVLVEEMAPPGVELVIGGIVDPCFGPVIMLGLGGVFVEILKDTAFRVCPIDRQDAEEMIEGLRGAPLLRGARGSAPANLSCIVAALLAVGGEKGLLVEFEREISELDINPLIVSPDGAIACDARIVLSDGDTSGA